MRALRLNIKQAFCNRVSLIIMFSGFVLICIYHYYYVIRYLGDAANGPISTDIKWIGFRGNEMDVYLLLMPVIASLPFSTSYNSDKSDGFKPFVSKEISLFSYSVTKYIVTFFCGGLLYTFPFILSLLFCKLTIPDGVPTAGSGIINDNGMFANLYETSPITYIAVYIGINFFICRFDGSFRTCCICMVPKGLYGASISICNYLYSLRPAKYGTPYNRRSTYSFI